MFSSSEDVFSSGRSSFYPITGLICSNVMSLFVLVFFNDYFGGDFKWDIHFSHLAGVWCFLFSCFLINTGFFLDFFGYFGGYTFLRDDFCGA